MLKVDVDVASSTIATVVTDRVMGYLSHLIIDLVFLIQGNATAELPERLLGKQGELLTLVLL